ncbi:hypothetical protein [Alicyclobacillus fructus]|uniref:hypothetical protein n=1 Tax=Alicyclobacillus fructus TaxID=2816082 RepID=UPI001A8F0CC2|nr:hypothetical protein [Alicyclobacillus fructus]
MHVLEILTLVATAIGGIGSAWAAIAATLGLRESKRYRRMNLQPLVTVSGIGRPEGGHMCLVGNRYVYQNARYTFTLRNCGPGPAVLGDNPFRGIIKHSFELTTELPRRFVYQDRPCPNVLPSGDSCNVTLYLGYSDETPMENPWEFKIFYNDMYGT